LKQKRVLISILQLHKTAAGAMRNTFEQIRYFKSRDYEVHVICDLMNKGSVRAAGAIPHTTLKWPGTGTLRRKFYDWQAQLWIKWHKPDLVVGHGDLSQQDVLCLHNSVHLAHELIHGTPLPETAEMWPIHTPQLRDHRFKHIIANSHLMRDDLIKRFKIPGDEITVVYPAYNDQKFTPISADQRSHLRQNFGLKQNELAVGLITSGNFKKRGVDVFFEALKMLPVELRERTRFWVVGKDLLPKPPEGIRVEQMPVREDVENYYRALDLFVLPARVEEFGRVQLEAMACGAPIISTAQVGASELLTGEAREFIMEHTEAKKLAVLIEQALLDENLRTRISALSSESAKVAAESRLAPLFDAVYKRYL
jgi:UDP-glucose:(heptosyl)LPS alpha-1,3-glucosyltransferase